MNIEYPLYGIIHNWKGLKEENYLYTAKELRTFDKELYDLCSESKDEWFDSGVPKCAWKTWRGRCLSNEGDVIDFLTGIFNDNPDDIEGWYWENVEDNDLYGFRSDTLTSFILEASNKIYI